MGFRFQRRIKIAPGIAINLSKSGISASVGPRGLKYRVGSDGQDRVTASIPGTGISYSTSGPLTGSNETPGQTEPTPSGRGRMVIWLLIALVVVALLLNH